jgi:DNA-binding transcriptional ArsR family regulator
MWSTDLVAHLSSKASQLLLSLVVSQTTEIAPTKQEFAALTGLSERSISAALSELEKAHLIIIIAQPGKPPAVRLENYEEQTENTVAVVTVEPVGAAGELVLEPTVQEEEEDKLIQRCRLADEEENRKGQVAALIACWDFAFPETDYAFARLQQATAKAWLVGRTAEAVGSVILASVKRDGERILYPRSYIEAALKGRDQKNKPPTEADPITDDLRAWTKLGRQQHGNK